MKPQISIIVSVYKAQKYLNDCINSVIHQVFDNWELILVNDDSKEESGVICDIFAAKDSRITVVHQENSGVSLTRNAGIKNPKGSIFPFWTVMTISKAMPWICYIVLWLHLTRIALF